MEKNKAVSFSQYQIYKNCQYRWYLDYAKGLKASKPSIHTVFGTAMHETLQHYLRVMFNKSLREADKIHLPTYFKIRFMEIYQKESAEGHFTTPEELTEFYEDAVAILEYFKNNRSLFFTKRNCKLIGIEIPINTPIVEGMENVNMRGFIDLVIYDKVLDKYIIYDIKTSTRGWKDYEKRNEVKISQVLLYKKFFSKLKKVSEDKIDVQFFIVKRKVHNNPDYPAKRVQEFKPTHGALKVKKAFNDVQDFVKNVFTPEGEYQDKVYPKNIDGCRFCPYLDKPDLCNRNIP